jgi:hypothetical protein
MLAVQAQFYRVKFSFEFFVGVELRFAPNGMAMKDRQDSAWTAFAASHPVPHTDP